MGWEAMTGCLAVGSVGRSIIDPVDCIERTTIAKSFINSNGIISKTPHLVTALRSRWCLLVRIFVEFSSLDGQPQRGPWGLLDASKAARPASPITF